MTEDENKYSAHSKQVKTLLSIFLTMSTFTSRHKDMLTLTDLILYRTSLMQKVAKLKVVHSLPTTANAERLALRCRHNALLTEAIAMQKQIIIRLINQQVALKNVYKTSAEVLKNKGKYLE